MPVSKGERVKTWLEVSTLLAAAAALLVSVQSLKESRRLEHETSTQTLISEQYELCRVLDVLRVEHPEVSHMLALPAQSGGQPWKNYELFKKHVRSVVTDSGPVTDAAKTRMYLQEHAVALHVFDIYEQTLFQRELAQTAGDEHRFKVLNTLAEYYEGRMLRSPRLRFHWDHGGSDMMETSTRERYEEKVRKAYPHDPVDMKSPLED